MKINYDIVNGPDPYNAVANKIRELTKDELGIEHIGTYIVCIKTTTLSFPTNELMLWDCETDDYYFDNDWYEGGEVELLGFIELEDVNVPIIDNPQG